MTSQAIYITQYLLYIINSHFGVEENVDNALILTHRPGVERSSDYRLGRAARRKVSVRVQTQKKNEFEKGVPIVGQVDESDAVAKPFASLTRPRNESHARNIN